MIAPPMPELVLRLILSAFLGSIIGLEREVRHHFAGLRTHMLVAVGSALIVISLLPYSTTPETIARVIAGIITGIGFLGAGTIIREEEKVVGLTTAAGVWFVAGIGIAAGLGQYLIAIITTLLGLIILRIKTIEKKITH